MRHLLSCFLVFVMIQNEVANARFIPYWSWERLFKEADLVVIAEAEKSEDSGEKINNPQSGEIVGVNTSFRIHQVVKGDQLDAVTVLHYRQGHVGDNQVGDSHGYVAFDTSGPERGTLRTEYLIFLKKRPDKRFEFVSGQWNANLSVRELRYMKP